MWAWMVQTKNASAPAMAAPATDGRTPFSAPAALVEWWLVVLAVWLESCVVACALA